MHGIYTNGHHLSLISGRRSENAALNPITSPTAARRSRKGRRREDGAQREEDKEGEIKSAERGGGGSVEVEVSGGEASALQVQPRK